MHRSMDQRICQWERLAHLKTRHCSLGFWTQKKVKICTVPDRPSYKNCMETLSDFERTRRRRCPPTQFPPRWRATLSHFFLCLCCVSCGSCVLPTWLWALAPKCSGSAIVVDRGRWPQFPHQHHGGPPAPSSCRQARDCSCSKLPCWVEVSALLVWNVLDPPDCWARCSICSFMLEREMKFHIALIVISDVKIF